MDLRRDDHHDGGRVVQQAGVAAGMRAVGGQERRQGGELVDIGDAGAFIARFRAGHAQRHDLAQEAALARRPLGLDVRVQRIVVLSIAA